MSLIVQEVRTGRTFSHITSRQDTRQNDGTLETSCSHWPSSQGIELTTKPMIRLCTRSPISLEVSATNWCNVESKRFNLLI